VDSRRCESGAPASGGGYSRTARSHASIAQAGSESAAIVEKQCSRHRAVAARRVAESSVGAPLFPPNPLMSDEFTRRGRSLPS
jgi:hypothetical protein